MISLLKPEMGGGPRGSRFGGAVPAAVRCKHNSPAEWEYPRYANPARRGLQPSATGRKVAHLGIANAAMALIPDGPSEVRVKGATL